ncbi:hypothetical protein [Legionella bononiensis]|uniref:Uncharacterized protein n=1 Tax=Legionella bononiensis TaxID=2793102 RepID=A0ABS1WAW7_9GAMM|nr:hypothetical protein [Legionella bononiensis]MBL7480260.1 hypothetical protein [Legionella bononiensis]MBL7526508.1 hypothetical protein [Legionella bononiensis]MBL7562998.1 hypothetical protein [Legionella bononiensis]
MKINPNKFFRLNENKGSTDDKRIKQDETPYKYTQKAKGTLHHYINAEVRDVLEELHGDYQDDYDSDSDYEMNSEEDSIGMGSSIRVGH